MEIRRSPARRRNALVVSDADLPESGATTKSIVGVEGNAAWLRQHAQPGSVVLIGGAGLVDFRIRVAQSHLRNDMLPSFWSGVFIASAKQELISVPLWLHGDPSLVPATNAVRHVSYREVDEVGRYPNIAAIDFAADVAAVTECASRLKDLRLGIDLPSMLLTWLGFVWGAGTRRNPLLDSVGLPGSVFVETAFGMAGVDLTPGLASASSCPEAIWHSALWWHGYFESFVRDGGAKSTPIAASSDMAPRTSAIQPKGKFRLLQKEAAVTYEVADRRRGRR